MKYRKSIIIIGITVLIGIILLTIVLLKETWLSADNVALHIVIDNRTDEQIGPFIISERQNSAPTQINQIEPFSVMDVYYKIAESWGENAITITDNYGKTYTVVPYFENQQKGRVDIRVECVSPDGLSGRIRLLISWYFSFKWRSWGTSACE